LILQGSERIFNPLVPENNYCCHTVDCWDSWTTATVTRHFNAK